MCVCVWLRVCLKCLLWSSFVCISKPCWATCLLPTCLPTYTFRPTCSLPSIEAPRLLSASHGFYKSASFIDYVRSLLIEVYLSTTSVREVNLDMFGSCGVALCVYIETCIYIYTYRFHVATRVHTDIRIDRLADAKICRQGSRWRGRLTPTSVQGPISMCMSVCCVCANLQMPAICLTACSQECSVLTFYANQVLQCDSEF